MPTPLALGARLRRPVQQACARFINLIILDFKPFLTWWFPRQMEQKKQARSVPWCIDVQAVQVILNAVLDLTNVRMVPCQRSLPIVLEGGTALNPLEDISHVVPRLWVIFRASPDISHEVRVVLDPEPAAHE
jgi:hypothetical protein